MPDNREPLFPLPDRTESSSPDSSYPTLSAPSEPRNPTSTLNRKQTRIAVAVVAVIALLSAGLYLATTGTENEENATAPVQRAANDGERGSSSDALTACSTAPRLQAGGATLSPAGLTVEVQTTTNCAQDSVLASPSTKINLTAGAIDVAAGLFDFSATPLLLTPNGTSNVTLTFPLGTFWSVPESLPAPIVASIDVAPSTHGNGVGASDFIEATATAPTDPSLGSVDSVSARALVSISEFDRTTVASTLADRWIPQISSKRVGLVAESRTWSNSDILQEHLQLRLRYPSAKLIWSGSWNTFSSPDFWVTAVGQTYPTGDAANTWCAANRLDRDHCYAKLVSSVRTVEGSTVLQK